MDVVVVGGGVAGLLVGIELRKLGHRVSLLERRPHLGGRVRTAYEGRQTSYEAGAWRVDATHTRCRSLFAHHEVDLTPALSATVLGSHAAPSRTGRFAGLTAWGAAALADGVPQADAADRDSGYTGSTDSANGSDPYSAEGPFLVAPQGFSLLVERMEKEAVALGVVIRKDARVVDLLRCGDGYAVRTRERRGSRFVAQTLRADRVVLCVPPHAWRGWSAMRDAKSLAAAVEAEALHHVYVRWKDPAGPMPEASHLDESLGQVVSSQYDGSRWWQISYSSGRVARLWHDYAMHDEKGFLDRIKAAMRKLVTFDSDVDLKRHFWPFAFHKWRAVPHFDLDDAVTRSVRPNPVRLPGVYCAGEAFSSHQGWIEGALQTTELVLDAFRRGEPTGVAVASPRWTVFAEGIPLDVSKFRGVHPGGEGALSNHVGEHVDELMQHVGHSDHAWAIVYSLRAQSCSTTASR